MFGQFDRNPPALTLSVISHRIIYATTALWLGETASAGMRCN